MLVYTQLPVISQSFHLKVPTVYGPVASVLDKKRHAMILCIQLSLQISEVVVCPATSILYWVQQKSLVFGLFSFYFLVVRMEW